MEDEISAWMDAHSYAKIADFNGMLAQERMSDPTRWERVQYMRSILDGQKG